MQGNGPGTCPSGGLCKAAHGPGRVQRTPHGSHLEEDGEVQVDGTGPQGREGQGGDWQWRESGCVEGEWVGKLDCGKLHGSPGSDSKGCHAGETNPTGPGINGGGEHGGCVEGHGRQEGRESGGSAGGALRVGRECLAGTLAERLAAWNAVPGTPAHGRRLGCHAEARPRVELAATDGERDIPVRCAGESRTLEHRYHGCLSRPARGPFRSCGPCS